mmetsp:Transcript_47433/g.92566  ORF Transcript_47433/g.92566 Transcript_47433/m.92566 type:complete len:515 (-) Transcript_47433:57-1601(-)
MGVHHHTELLDRGPRRDSVGTLLNKIGGVNPNDVHRHDLPRVFIVQHLGHARPLPLRQRLGVSAEAPRALPQAPSLLCGALHALLFGGSHHGDLRVGETGGGHGVVVDGVLPPADVLDRGDALCGGGVGEHHDPVGVTDTPDVGHDVAVGGGLHAHVGVHGDEAPVGLDASGLEAHVLGGGDAARGDHGGVHFEGLHVLLGLGVYHLDDDRLLPTNPGCDLAGEYPCSVIDRSRSDEYPLRLLGDLPVEGGHDVVHRLDEGHLRSQCRVHVAELQTDVPAANNGHVLRHRFQLQRAVRSIHRLLVHRHARRHERNRTRGQDDVPRGIHLPRGSVLHLVRHSRQDPAPLHDVHAQSHQTVLEIPLHFVRQILRVRGDGRPVVLHTTLHADAQGVQVARVAHVPDPTGRRQQGLRGNTPAVHAGSAHVVAGEDGRRQLLGAGVEGAAVSADAASDHDDVVVEGAVGHAQRGRGRCTGGEGASGEGRARKEGHGGDREDGGNEQGRAPHGARVKKEY